MRDVAYVGNFRPSFSTESHVAAALEHNGVTVRRMQEDEPETWQALTGASRPAEMLLWTRTGWDWPHTRCEWDHDQAREIQRAALANMARLDVPTVGYHLDRWWGLDREGQIHDEPFFRCDLVVTADGGHDDNWRTAGVNHLWMPPAVSLAETDAGTRNRRLASPVAFVGSWRPGYHAEWQHRPELISWLRRTYGASVRFWPARPGMPVRGQMLRDLYASVDVIVGDSCLAGGATRYWSDRIPETVGRGGFLVHPDVDGIEDHYVDGLHLVTWPLGDWGALRETIDGYLGDPEARHKIATAGRDHVRAHHTYEQRMTALVAHVEGGDYR